MDANHVQGDRASADRRRGDAATALALIVWRDAIERESVQPGSAAMDFRTLRFDGPNTPTVAAGAVGRDLDPVYLAIARLGYWLTHGDLDAFGYSVTQGDTGVQTGRHRVKIDAWAWPDVRLYRMSVFDMDLAALPIEELDPTARWTQGVATFGVDGLLSVSWTPRLGVS